MSNYPEVIIPTDYHLKMISQTFHNFPPEILMNGIQYPMPYTMDTIASMAVKVAATAKMVNIQGAMVRVPSTDFAVEMKTYLGAFDNHVTDELIRHVGEFIRYLIVRFTLNNWYMVDGECPYRFIGFTSQYSNTYDIVVRCG